MSILKQYREHCKNGGSTFVGEQNMIGKPFYSVGIGVERIVNKGMDVFSQLKRFELDNKKLLKQENYALGTWVDTETGKTYLDIVRLIPKANNYGLTKQIAESHNEIAFFDLEKMEEIRIK